MDTFRNNLDSPPRPRQAWSGQDITTQGYVSSSTSEQSWIHSTSGDTPSDMDSSCEILNSFVGGSSTPLAHSRPVGSPYSDRPDGLGSPSLGTHTYSDQTLSTITSDITSPSVPTPAPRKRTPQILDKSSRLERENQELVKKVEVVKGEKSELESQLMDSRDTIRRLEETNRMLTTKNLSLQGQAHSSQRAEDLEREVERLTQVLSQARLEPMAPPEASNSRELAEMKAELEQRVAEVTSLRAQKRELEDKVSALTLETCESNINSVAARTGGPNPPRRIELKLNDVYGQLKEKQLENDKLRRQLDEQNSGVGLELERAKEKLRRVTEEKEELEHKHLTDALQQKLDVDTQVQGLSRRLSSTQSELNTLASEHTTKCQELVVASQLQEEKHRECQDFQEQLTALQEEYEQYKRSYSEGNQYKIDRLAASMSSLEDQLQAVTKERDDLQTKYEEVSDDYSRLYDQNIQLDKAYREMKGERHKDTVAMEEALKEITKEASDTLGSYNTTIQRLGAVERERDEFRMKHEQALNILAQRGQELTAARQAVQDCERSWSVTMEQRLAAQRKEAEEMQDVIRAQMTTYRDDFNEERTAREKMAEDKFQLSVSLKAKSEEIRQLKMKLNAQAAAINMQDDFEQSSYPDDSGPPLRAQDPYQPIPPFQGGGPQRQNY